MKKHGFEKLEVENLNYVTYVWSGFERLVFSVTIFANFFANWASFQSFLQPFFCLGDLLFLATVWDIFQNYFKSAFKTSFEHNI